MLCFVQRSCPRVLRFGTLNQFEMKQYILVVNLLFWTSVSTVGLSERGLNLHVLHVAVRQYAMFCAEDLF